MSLSQLAKLLPLPESELQQVYGYAATLSKEDTAAHFSDLLGDSTQAIDFISSFNSRRHAITPSGSSQPAHGHNDLLDVPKPPQHSRKGQKKGQLHVPPPRQIQSTSNAPSRTYSKKDNQDYIPQKPSANSSPIRNTFALDPKSAATQSPMLQTPSLAGYLVSDPRSKRTSSLKTSRTSSPAPVAKTKVKITGGPSMHAPSTTLSSLDSAIRSLEISTNSTLLPSEKRRCDCMAARHALLAAAPNCLSCGKIICVKEGLGPCTFCGSPLLTAVEVQSMIRELRDERGREKMAVDNSAHRKAEVSRTPTPFTAPSSRDLNPAEMRAKEHRDRLLGFQSQNAKRTTVKDEAADFDPVDHGGAIWASPVERARMVKKQQRLLAEQEWNARPEWEKRKQVVSIDIVKGKAVRRMVDVEREGKVESEEEPEESAEESNGLSGDGGGAFSRNPLLVGLVQPVYDTGKGKGKAEASEGATGRKQTWRRVQDDMEDNEDIILDGGIYGGEVYDRIVGDETGC